MSSSKIFFFCLISFIAGIAAASFLEIKFSLILFGIAVAIVLAIDKKTRLAGGFLLVFLAGVLRCNSSFRISDNSVAKLADGKTHIIRGTIAEESDERLTYTDLTVKPDYLDGEILVQTEKYSGYEYGDEVILEGKIEIAGEDGGFSWRGYLMRYGIQAIMPYPKINLASSGNGSRAYAVILAAKQYLGKKIEQSVYGIKADFLLALILGYKRNISEYWKAVFSSTGTSHIISISGLHISIISGMLVLLLLEAGVNRKKAFWIASFFLLIYIILIGMSASAVRAGIMGFLVLLAVRFGRLANPRNALAFAAAAMLAANPLLLRYDAGFQLSFLSVIGIFYLWPILENWTDKLPNPLKLRSALNLSLSAQIITLPLVIYHFKIISLIAPAANLIIVPMIPLIFLIGMLPLFFSFLPLVFLKFLFLPYKEFSGFILWILEKIGGIKTVEISINWGVVLAIYIIFTFVILLETKKQRYKNIGI